MEKQKVLLIGWVLSIFVIAGIAGAVYAQYSAQKADYENLQEKYSADLKEKNQTISYWKNKHNTLEDNYESLQQDYNSLENDYNDLQSEYNSLQNDYTALETNYNTLDEEFDDYKDMVNIRTPSVSEKRTFITPDSNSIENKAASILGSHFDGDLSMHEVKDFTDWVYDHIDYNHDIYVGEKNNIGKECWKYPAETLQQGHGDCEDKALLLASLALSQEDVGWLYCAEVRFTKDGDTMHHVCVFANVKDDKMHIFDPTAQNTDFPYDGGWRNTESRIESSALDEYRKENDFDSIKVKSVFNENTYKTFSSNEDFYNWF